MNKCARAGINVTKRCNWKCATCFYRWKEDFNTAGDLEVEHLHQQIGNAKRRGCKHIVAIGFGETSLYKHIDDMILYTKLMGMTSSIITNGTLDIDKYETMYDLGLNHLHISTHGHTPEVLNEIAGNKKAFEKQSHLLHWLGMTGKSFRTNTTIQKLNYQLLPEITQYCIDAGSKHINLLGFLPHYEWGDKLLEVAVNPVELRPYLEESIHIAMQKGVMVTLRYHPFCCIDSAYHPFITNARYVLYDPWEWDYDCFGKDDATYQQAAINMGDSVAIKERCSGCYMKMHCGGWNETYAKAFDYKGIIPITDTSIPQEFGAIFNLNKTNHAKGWF